MLKEFYFHNELTKLILWEFSEFFRYDELDQKKKKKRKRKIEILLDQRTNFRAAES